MQVLAIGSSEYIAELEIKAIAIYQTRNPCFGYNLALGGDLGSHGRIVSDETKAKMAKARIGRKLSAEHKANISKAGKGHKGCIHTEENKRLNGLRKKGQVSAMKGKKHSAESRAKMSISHAGVPLSPKRCADISARLMGNQYTLGLKQTAEFCKNQSLRMQGNTYSLGKKASPETKAKLSAAQKFRRIREKLKLGEAS